MSNLSNVYSAEHQECPEAQVVRSNELPDDVIPFIISHLNVKDAVRASVVFTKRWRHFIMNLTNLDFDASDTSLQERELEDSYVTFRQNNKFKNWVNQVLRMNRVPYINTFRVCYVLDGFLNSDIDRWIGFAISRHVKKLELDFTVNNYFLKGAFYYDLNYNVLRKAQKLNGDGLNYLTSLCLKFVNIDGTLLASILRRCQCLEQLVVENSYCLERLQLNNLWHRLKHLAIRRCERFKLFDVNIDAATSFKLHCIKDAKYRILDNASHARFVMQGVWNLEVDFVNNDIVEWSSCGSDFGFLKSLCLKSVSNVTTSFLNSPLSHFLFLERLILEGANELKSMKITSSLCRLKHVEITCCKKFEKLEVDLHDVVSLKVSCTCTAVKLSCIDNPFILRFNISLDKIFTLSVDLDYVQGFNHPCTIDSDGMKGMIHSSRSISFLKSLDFVCVNISRELLGFLISRLPVLERLLVRNSDDLVSLKVTESSKCLKYLDICYCQKMKELEVHAPNLTSLAFAWNHRFANVVFGSLSSLVDLFFGEYIQQLLLRLKQIGSFSAELSKLSLHTSMVVHKNLVIPTFDNVKQMEFRVSLRRHQSLAPLRCFVEACPLLQELTLEIKWDCDCAMKSTFNSITESGDGLTTHDGINSCTFPHLKKFELDGPFRSSSHVDLEYSFALHIIKNAINLGNFLCNTSASELKFHEIADSSKEEQIGAAKKLAKGQLPGSCILELARLVSAHVKFTRYKI